MELSINLTPSTRLLLLVGINSVIRSHLLQHHFSVRSLVVFVIGLTAATYYSHVQSLRLRAILQSKVLVVFLVGELGSPFDLLVAR